MTLTDGRGELYQWDTGRTLTGDDATVTQVHFQNRAYGRTIDVDVNNSVAIIPDELLQKAGELRVYAFAGTAESGFTKVERVFNIVRRNKPNDYMFTPTEQKSLEGLQKQIGDLSDLKTDAKTDIVAAINETATAGQTLGLTGATVGQVPAVKAVDGNGVPTEWESIELPDGGSALVVNLTMGDGGNITADKTFPEIKAAHDDGKVVEAKFAGAIFHLQNLVDSEAVFAMTNANSFKVLTVDFVCTSDNVWSMSQHGFDAYSLGLTGATVGQTVKIKTVDASGIPTEWEAADAASGDIDWQLVDSQTLPAENSVSELEWTGLDCDNLYFSATIRYGANITCTGVYVNGVLTFKNWYQFQHSSAITTNTVLISKMPERYRAEARASFVHKATSIYDSKWYVTYEGKIDSIKFVFENPFTQAISLSLYKG